MKDGCTGTIKKVSQVESQLNILDNKIERSIEILKAFEDRLESVLLPIGNTDVTCETAALSDLTPLAHRIRHCSALLSETLERFDNILKRLEL